MSPARQSRVSHHRPPLLLLFLSLVVLLPAFPWQPAAASLPEIEQSSSLHIQDTSEALITFLRDDSLWLMNEDGSNQREITEIAGPVRDFSWSPSGHYLLIEHGGPSPVYEGGSERSEWITSLYDVETGRITELRRTTPVGLWPSVPRTPVWALDADELLALDLDLQGTGTYTVTQMGLEGTVTPLATFEEPLICGGPDGPFATMWQLSYLQKGGPWTRNVYDPIVWSSGDRVAYVDPQCGHPRVVDLASGEASLVPHRPLIGIGKQILVQGEGASWSTPSLHDPATGVSMPLFEGDVFATGPDGTIYFTRIVQGSPSTFVSRFDDTPMGITDNTVELWRTDVAASEPTRIASFSAFGAGMPRITGDGSAIVLGIVDNPTDMVGVDESGVDWFTPDLYSPHLKAVRVDVTTGEVTMLAYDAILPKPQPAASVEPTPTVGGQEPIEPTGDNLPEVTPAGAAQPGGILLEPSSDWIAYVGDDSNIWLMQPDGSQQTQITTDGSMEHSQPTWSPDGTILVFHKHLSPDAGIMVYQDGKLTSVPNTALCGPVAITLDNSRLLYSCAGREDYETEPTAAQLASDPQLAAIASSNLDGTDARVLVSYMLPNTGQNGVIWVDSGAVGFNGLSDLAVNPSTGEILATFSFLHSQTAWLVDPNGAPTLTEIPFSDANQDRLGPSSAEFLPGSEQIVALVCEQGCYPGLSEQVRSILILNRDGSIAQRLISSETAPGLGSFTVSPDGTTLMYSTYSTGGDVPPMLWSMPIGEGPTALIPGTNPAWQPNPGVTPQVPVSSTDNQATQPSGSSGTSGESTTVPGEFLGNWNGQGTQVNPSVEWPVTIDLTGGGPGSVVGTSDYPNDGCGGNLVLQTATADTIVLVENLTYGLDACTDGGTITLGRIDGSTLSFGWAGIRKDGSASSATGTLSRPDGTTGSSAPAGGQTTTQTSSQDVDGPVIDTTQLHSWYLGIFSGTGEQENPTSTWPITITFTGGRPDEVIGSVEYPTLGCGGELVLDSINPNDEWLGFKATERITYGHDNCIDGGTFTFSSESAVGITFHWTSPASATRAQGNLPRVEPGAAPDPADQPSEASAPVGEVPATEEPVETAPSGGGPPSIYDDSTSDAIVPIEPEGEGG